MPVYSGALEAGRHRPQPCRSQPRATGRSPQCAAKRRDLAVYDPATASPMSPEAAAAVEGVDLGWATWTSGLSCASGGGGAANCAADQLTPASDRYEYPRRFPVASFATSGTRVLSEVQTGCDARCSYCVIPDARGHPAACPWRRCGAVRILAGRVTARWC